MSATGPAPRRQTKSGMIRSRSALEGDASRRRLCRTGGGCARRRKLALAPDALAISLTAARGQPDRDPIGGRMRARSARCRACTAPAGDHARIAAADMLSAIALRARHRRAESRGAALAGQGLVTAHADGLYFWAKATQSAFRRVANSTRLRIEPSRPRTIRTRDAL
jgi:hypothetical protein